MIKIFADKRPILFCVVVFIVNAIVALSSLALFASLFGIDIANLDNVELEPNTLTALMLNKVVVSAVLVLILFTLQMKSVMTLSWKGIGRGLLLGWFLILVGIFVFLVQSDFARAISFEPGKIVVLLLLVVYTLLIGVSEEFLCRGIFYNVLFNKYRNVHAAVFISSAIFGVMHLSNLIGGAPLGETLSQVCYAFALGVLLCAVYVRCKNIWAVVLIHALFDFLSFTAEVLAPAAAADVNWVETNALLMTAVVSVAAVCIGLFLIRKSWHAEAAESVSDSDIPPVEVSDSDIPPVEVSELSARETSPTA